MKPNPILEEIWRVKDELAREAGFDVHRLCRNTHQWAQAHPHPGPVISTLEELRRFALEKERNSTERNLLTIKENPHKTT